MFVKRYWLVVGRWREKRDGDCVYHGGVRMSRVRVGCVAVTCNRSRG